MCFLQLAAKLQHWTAREGLYLQKIFGVYQALSLSLSLSPPLEERVRGEVRGSWTLIGSNQRVPYLAGPREFHAIFDHTIFGHIYM